MSQDGVRQSHALVCGQLEAARVRFPLALLILFLLRKADLLPYGLPRLQNELGNQEDELLVLREIHEEHVAEIGELRRAKEFAEVEVRSVLLSLSSCSMVDSPPHSRQRSMAVDSRRELEVGAVSFFLLSTMEAYPFCIRQRRTNATIADYRSENEALRQQLEQMQKELEEAKVCIFRSFPSSEGS
jgi:hypothetical protein